MARFVPFRVLRHVCEKYSCGPYDAYCYLNSPGTSSYTFRNGLVADAVVSITDLNLTPD